MSGPQGSDRIQQDVPTASGTGDNSDVGGSSSGYSFDDDLPATADSDMSRARTAGSSGEAAGSAPRFDDRTQR